MDKREVVWSYLLVLVRTLTSAFLTNWSSDWNSNGTSLFILGETETGFSASCSGDVFIFGNVLR